MKALNNNYFDSKSDLLKVISDIIEDKQIVNHRKQETDAESGLDEFEKIEFDRLMRTYMPQTFDYVWDSKKTDGSTACKGIGVL